MAKQFYLEDEIPTPEELKEREERAAEIRSRWTPEETVRRMVAAKGRCGIKTFTYVHHSRSFKFTDF